MNPTREEPGRAAHATAAQSDQASDRARPSKFVLAAWTLTNTGMQWT